MGIASIDSTVPAEPGNPDNMNVKKESTPTYLSGESLTFPLVTAVGSAALTLIIAFGKQPTPFIVLTVARICGFLVTIWGIVDARAADGQTGYTGGTKFKLAVTGVLNTVLLATALWGSVAVIQQAAKTLGG